MQRNTIKLTVRLRPTHSFGIRVHTLLSIQSQDQTNKLCYIETYKPAVISDKQTSFIELTETKNSDGRVADALTMQAPAEEIHRRLSSRRVILLRAAAGRWCVAERICASFRPDTPECVKIRVRIISEQINRTQCFYFPLYKGPYTN
jgi:hypothetical protein